MRHARIPLIPVAAFALACGEAPPPADYPDAVAADPDHYSVEYENDAVRLLRITYGAGEESVMHKHPASCAVALSDASWEMTDPEGAVSEDTGVTGTVDCFPADVHKPRNAGTGVAELILVEFKEGATAGSATSEYPAADVADPDHYTVEWDDSEVARLLRISYGPGETSTMHHHPANCAIFLGAQQATFELPDGEVVEPPPFELGQVRCSDAETHLPTNVGEQPIAVVLLEFKGRDSLE